MFMWFLTSWNPDFVKVGFQIVRFSNGRDLAMAIVPTIQNQVWISNGFWQNGIYLSRFQMVGLLDQIPFKIQTIRLPDLFRFQIPNVTVLMIMIMAKNDDCKAEICPCAMFYLVLGEFFQSIFLSLSFATLQRFTFHFRSLKKMQSHYWQTKNEC